MVECTANESLSGMTQDAIQLCQKVVSRFAGCPDPIMTGNTIVHDAGMIKIRRRHKARGDMAQRAITIGLYMAGRFTCGGITIVTGSTVIPDTPMIKPSTGKRGGVMADEAILGRRNMGVWFDGRDRVSTLMTRYAVIDDTFMAEHHRVCRC